MIMTKTVYLQTTGSHAFLRACQTMHSLTLKQSPTCNCCLVISANNLTEEYSLMILKLQELINRQTNMHSNQIIKDA